MGTRYAPSWVNATHAVKQAWDGDVDGAAIAHGERETDSSWPSLSRATLPLQCVMPAFWEQMDIFATGRGVK